MIYIDYRDYLTDDYVEFDVPLRNTRNDEKFFKLVAEGEQLRLKLEAMISEVEAMEKRMNKITNQMIHLNEEMGL